MLENFQNKIVLK